MLRYTHPATHPLSPSSLWLVSRGVISDSNAIAPARNPGAREAAPLVRFGLYGPPMGRLASKVGGSTVG